ncbi:(2Fe-2S)-binding protein [Rhizobium sp. 3T7]|uniref:(2Fe-2S)-binding protein n=1 Tax=Rhizobium sp. 3T7 TaxID=2874922 RepID=UPI001CCC604B|nr:(2Fe-2S)-binding protein [Rhizobium sp. 3T7]MBZ9792669.1 (2Fe-2S)-binding protein [Rhizobium sp. 3T7]
MVDQARFGPNRLSAAGGEAIEIAIDGQSYTARRGETVLTAIRMGPGHARNFEFLSERRAGFCLMGACQDCWLWRKDGRRLRTCTSRVEAGMDLLTSAPEAV